MMSKLIRLIAISLFFSALVFAQLPNGEKSLMHTQTAVNVPAGMLNIYNNMNFFTKAGDFIGSSKPVDFSATNYWLVAGNMIFTYGIIDHLDASLGLRLYQDTHYQSEFNFPDDIFLTLRGGSFPFGNDHFQAALLSSFRIPAGEKHNYPFTEYTSGAFEFGFLSAFSFYTDRYFKNRDLSIHFNMGIWDYNEKGRVIYTYETDYGAHKKGDKLKATVNTVDFRLALAAVYPTALVDYRAELSGILYLTRPDDFVYSAEEWAYFSPSLRFHTWDWLDIDLGADFRVSPQDRQHTNDDLIIDISENLKLPKNYPSWKVQLGLNINLEILRGRDERSEKGYVKAKHAERLKIFETILDEKENAKTVQKEIESLREVRRKVEDEIEDIKQELEE
jgi:hypothetical protein